MLKLKALFVTSLFLGLSAAPTAKALAGGGRMFSGGHPYHNGYLFVPPSSAYEAVRYRPPIWYGAPSYYFPQSYLAPNQGSYGHYPPVNYPGVPVGRAGYYYMSAQGVMNTYPW